METKHTPGPWEVSRISQYTVMQGNSTRTVATTGGYSDNSRPEEVEIENRANAVLIAAAPEMLDMLQKALNRINKMLIWADILAEDRRQYKKDIEALIKKATEQ